MQENIFKKIAYKIIVVLFIIPFFGCATEKYVAMRLEKAKECFGDKLDYKKIAGSLKDDYKTLKRHSMLGQNITTHYATSKHNTRFLVYDFHKRGEHNYWGTDFGRFTIITLEEDFKRLQENKDFQKFAFPVIATVKICAKKYNLKIPKYLMHIILNECYTKHPFTYSSIRRLNGFVLQSMQRFFPLYTTSKVFIDNNNNVAINFKSESDENILYTMTDYTVFHVILPKQLDEPFIFDDKNRVIINPELCCTGTMHKARMQKDNEIDPKKFLLTVKKDDKKFMLNLPFYETF